jgi:hypothetical protein
VADAGWAAGCELLAWCLPLGRVAEWQTRWLQVPVFERMWGFKSPLAHGKAPAQQGLLWSPDPLPIRRIRVVVDAVLAEMDDTFDARYAKSGRSSVPPESLLKARS